MQLARKRSGKIARAISGLDPGYSRIIGVPTAKAEGGLARKATKEFEDKEEDFEMVDLLAARE